MVITGHRCIIDCEDYLEPVVEEEPEEKIYYWSDPESWPNLDNRVPVEGEAVVVNKGWKVIYDLWQSPLYKSVEINGQVDFMYDSPAVLNTYALWVRAGTLNIGSAD